jgi:KDO2-lipid IV(A) lauroyltransferase
MPPVTPRDVFVAMGEDLASSLVLLNARERACDHLPISGQAMEVLEQARAAGSGVVFASAHLGPMELVAASVAERGIAVSTLARESYDPRFTALYQRMRTPRGVKTIFRGSPGAELAVVRALRQHGVVGFPMDLMGRGMAAVTCRFLGEDALVPVGPARIALRTGAWVVAGTVAPRADGAMEVTAELVSTEGLGRDDPSKALTERLVEVLERRIRAIPAHWPWMHGATAASLPAKGVSR